MITISARDKDSKNFNAYIDEKPDKCPLCKTSIDPTIYYDTAFITGDYSLHNYELQLLFKCTVHECLRYFIATYYTDPGGESKFPLMMFLKKLAPSTFVAREFNEVISKLSPNFCSIYNQANAAETSGLNDICGMGYRKSLEFLVKDYLIENKPTKADEIKNTFLGDCIKNFIDDVRVKECAELATWLGNDETHYVKKWIDKDLQDLKVLIDLTLHWIESSKLSEHYKANMKRTIKTSP